MLHGLPFLYPEMGENYRIRKSKAVKGEEHMQEKKKLQINKYLFISIASICAGIFGGW